jgi:predicted Kef-type K+ transport protein
MSSQISDFIRDHLLTLPDLAKFALGLILIVTVPRLCRLARIPSSVGLLLGGVVIGPYVLGILARSARSPTSWRTSASCC